MKTISEQAVREIAVANPATTRVFERLGIDYCCGGKLSLRAACERANVDLASAMQALESCGQTPKSGVPDGAALGDLTQYIVGRHHEFVRSESPRIQALLGRVCEKHGPSHKELFDVQTLFNLLTADLSQHMMKEERILFPYIAALDGAIETKACFDSVESPIAAMMADHEDAGAILAKLRRLTNGYEAPAGSCPTFRALYGALADFERDLHEHVHLENNILFPRAIQAEHKRLNAPALAR